MSRLSLHAFFIDSIEAPAFPKDFTTESPLAYSRVAPVRSLFAAARIGAFLVLYFEMMNRNIRETAAGPEADQECPEEAAECREVLLEEAEASASEEECS